MGITDIYQKFVQASRSINDQTIDPHLYDIAQSAYQYFVEIFGPPADAAWKFEIVTAPYAGMIRDPLRRLYILTIRAHDPLREQRIASVAHEIYHRVTSRRRGLHKYLWVDEMLAFLATYHFLCEHGFQDYAQDNLKVCYAQTKRLDIHTIKSLRRRPTLLDLLGPQYPPGFTSSIAVLATTIESVVGWEKMCTLVQSRSWEQWLQTLPEKCREHICEIIQE